MSKTSDAVKKLFDADPLGFAAYETAYFDRPIEFQFVRSALELPLNDLRACLEMVEYTAGADYRASSIGWKPTEKIQEMGDKDMMYLLVRQADADSRILGFMSFMFTFDEPPAVEREVVYMYEIHLLHLLRGRGLGSQLINFLEVAASRCSVTKTMLTVFAANEGARRLYEKRGYVKDSCSPEDRKMRKRVIKADYVIMSKELA
ncbi:hypothetical protein CC86DRAFT_365797 [Ophiobolus disseminans]|uniref:N-alpha-acetyltransferase 40 n=1 Tax=Ophiobolus disseminans TaxID=1469910 RepID=A0A6A7AF32_9PLEO|nr:hypothetical protein CC86DRAFT_365797 [Ophiobolus disseminans]